MNILDKIVKEKNNYQQISIMAPTTVDAGVWSTALLSKPSLIISNSSLSK